MHPAMERSAERMARNDRTFPKVPGQNANALTCEMSTGDNRTSDKISLSAATAHRATDSKRFGVRPSSGGNSDLWVGGSLNGQDDGSDYFAEYRAQGGLFAIPIAKTPKQDQLRRLCVAYLAGEELGSEIEQGMREFIAKIQATDADHGNAWRVAMTIGGLYR